MLNCRQRGYGATSRSADELSDLNDSQQKTKHVSFELVRSNTISNDLQQAQVSTSGLSTADSAERLLNASCTQLQYAPVCDSGSAATKLMPTAQLQATQQQQQQLAATIQQQQIQSAAFYNYYGCAPYAMATPIGNWNTAYPITTGPGMPTAQTMPQKQQHQPLHVAQEQNAPTAPVVRAPSPILPMQTPPSHLLSAGPYPAPQPPLRAMHRRTAMRTQATQTDSQLQQQSQYSQHHLYFLQHHPHAHHHHHHHATDPLVRSSSRQSEKGSRSCSRASRQLNTTSSSFDSTESTHRTSSRTGDIPDYLTLSPRSRERCRTRRKSQRSRSVNTPSAHRTGMSFRTSAARYDRPPSSQQDRRSFYDQLDEINRDSIEMLDKEVEDQLAAAELIEMEQQLSARLAKLSRLNQLEAFEHVHAHRTGSGTNQATSAATRAYLRSVRKSVGEIEHLLRGRISIDLDLDADRSEPIGKMAERLHSNKVKALHSSAKSRSIEGLIERIPSIRSTICSTRQPIDFIEAVAPREPVEIEEDQQEQLSPPLGFQDSDEKLERPETRPSEIARALDQVYDLALGDALEGALERVEHVMRSVQDVASMESQSCLDLITSTTVPAPPVTSAASGSSVYLSAISSSRDSYWTAKTSFDSPLTIATCAAEANQDSLDKIQDFGELSPVKLQFERKSTQSTIEETPDRSDMLTVIETNADQAEQSKQDYDHMPGESVDAFVQEQQSICPDTAEHVFVDESIEEPLLFPSDSKVSDALQRSNELDSNEDQCQTFSLSESERFVRPTLTRPVKVCLEAVACEQLIEHLSQTTSSDEAKPSLHVGQVQDDESEETNKPHEEEEDETEKQSDHDVLDEGEPVDSDELEAFAGGGKKVEPDDPALKDPALIHVGSGVYLRRNASSELSTVSEVSEEFSNLPGSIGESPLASDGASEALSAAQSPQENKSRDTSVATSSDHSSTASSSTSSGKRVALNSDDSDFAHLNASESNSSTSTSSSSTSADSTSAGGLDLSSVNLDLLLQSSETKSTSDHSALEMLKSKTNSSSGSSVVSDSSSGASAMVKLLEVATAAAEQTVAAALATLNAQQNVTDLPASSEEISSNGFQTTGTISFDESNTTNRTTANIAVIEPSTSVGIGSSNYEKIQAERNSFAIHNLPDVCDGLSSLKSISAQSRPTDESKEPAKISMPPLPPASSSWPLTNATPTPNLLRSTQSDAMVQELLGYSSSSSSKPARSHHSYQFGRLEEAASDTSDRWSAIDSTSYGPMVLSLQPGESFGEPPLDSLPTQQRPNADSDRPVDEARPEVDRPRLDPMPLDLLDLNNNHSDRLNLNERLLLLEVNAQQSIGWEQQLNVVPETNLNGSAQPIAIAMAVEPIVAERPAVDTGESSQATERDVAQFSLEQQNSHDLLDDDSLSMCFTQSIGAAQPFSLDQIESLDLPPTPSLPIPVPDGLPVPATTAVKTRKAMFERHLSGSIIGGLIVPISVVRMPGQLSGPASIAPLEQTMGDQTQVLPMADSSGPTALKRSSRVKALLQQFESGSSDASCVSGRAHFARRAWKRSESEPVAQDNRLMAIGLAADVAATSAPQSLERKLSEHVVRQSTESTSRMKNSVSSHATNEDASLLESMATNDALPSSCSSADEAMRPMSSSVSEPIDVCRANLTESQEADRVSKSPVAAGLSSSEAFSQSRDVPMVVAYEPMLSSAADVSSSIERIESDASALQSTTVQTTQSDQPASDRWFTDETTNAEEEDSATQDQVPQSTEQGGSQNLTSQNRSESAEECSCSTAHYESTDRSESRPVTDQEPHSSTDRPQPSTQPVIFKRKLVAQSTLPGYSVGSNAPLLRPLTATRSVGLPYHEDLSELNSFLLWFYFPFLLIIINHNCICFISIIFNSDAQFCGNIVRCVAPQYRKF